MCPWSRDARNRTVIAVANRRVAVTPLPEMPLISTGLPLPYISRHADRDGCVIYKATHLPTIQCLVSLGGFEPPTPRIQTGRAGQTALQADVGTFLNE